MNKKQWSVLFCLYAIYLLVGAALFYYVEAEEEEFRLKKEQDEADNITDLIQKSCNNKEYNEIITKLSHFCGKPLNKPIDVKPKKKWDYYHSLFFVITVVSTIGYGNLSPTTMCTRISMIFYGLVGIPLNGIVILSLGGFFGETFKKLYKRWKSSEIKADAARLGLIGQVILYLVPGFTFFIFLPAVIMTMMEDWEYDKSVYYAFVTLTTIGFGDIVAGVENKIGASEVWYNIYKAFLILWIVGGLGYVVMVLGFITQGMQSKKVLQLEKILARNIKETPHRIRKELQAFLREFIFLRVKPVYKDEMDFAPHIIERTQSCPDLNLHGDPISPSLLRQRAFSDCYRHETLQKTPSESNLALIDKERTFRPSQTFVKEQELLLKVFDALSSHSDSSDGEEDKGVNLFPDQDILADEQYGSNWSMGTKSFNSDLIPQRRRAVSDVRPPLEKKYQYDPYMTINSNLTVPDSVSNLKARQRTFSAPSDIIEEQRNGFLYRLKNKFKSKDDKDKNIDIEKQIPTIPPIKKKMSMFTPREEKYLRKTSRGRVSTASARRDSVLEQTTLADFFRAVSVLSTTPDVLADPPRRQRGYSVAAAPALTQNRTRRMPIRSNYQNRRSSLMFPPSPVPTDRRGSRRFSLRPVEENLLAPAPSTSPPPPYTPIVRTPKKKFSTNTTTLNIPQINITSPVQRQVIRKEKEDTN